VVRRWSAWYLLRPVPQRVLLAQDDFIDNAKAEIGHLQRNPMSCGQWVALYFCLPTQAPGNSASSIRFDAAAGALYRSHLTCTRRPLLLFDNKDTMSGHVRRHSFPPS